MTMNRETWADPEVRAELKDHFIPVHVDQDSRPDISQRYERWGWPATIIFGTGRHRDREAARLLFAEVLHPGAEGDGERSLAGGLRRARRPGARAHAGDRPDGRAARRHSRLHEQGLRPGQRRLEQEQAGRRADARLVPRSRQGRRRGGGGAHQAHADGDDRADRQGQRRHQPGHPGARLVEALAGVPDVRAAGRADRPMRGRRCCSTTPPIVPRRIGSTDS